MDSVVAGVAQRVERKRDQSGGDDSEGERPVGAVSQFGEGAVEADGIVWFVVDRRLDQECPDEHEHISAREMPDHPDPAEPPLNGG